MSKALITGGAGFIGSHLARRLLADGLDVVAVDDMSWGLRARLPTHDRFRMVEGDVRQVGTLLSGERFDYVFHCAALISAYESLEKPHDYFDANVGGLLRLLEFCRSQQGTRVVFASTSGVYGNTPEATKREHDCPAPCTVYAATKLAGEHLLAMYRDRFGFDDVSLRFFNVYGPAQSSKHPYANVTCRFSRAAAKGGAVELYGDGQQTRDFVFVADVVEAMVRVAMEPIKRRVYNVGTGRDTAIGELLELANGISPGRMQVSRHAPWPNDIRHIRADVTLIREDHGFEARTSLAEGLGSTIDFFRTASDEY